MVSFTDRPLVPRRPFDRRMGEWQSSLTLSAPTANQTLNPRSSCRSLSRHRLHWKCINREYPPPHAVVQPHNSSFCLVENDFNAFQKTKHQARQNKLDCTHSLDNRMAPDVGQQLELLVIWSDMKNASLTSENLYGGRY